MCIILSIVIAEGLARITAKQVATAMQVSESNPMVGLEGRASLLINLSKALKAKPEYFGSAGRPGNLIGGPLLDKSHEVFFPYFLQDFLQKESKLDPSGTQRIVHIFSLWGALIEGLTPIWPQTRASLGGIPLGDVWPCDALRKEGATKEGENLVPFHKLTGWTTYSLVDPLQKVLHWKFEGIEHMTGLPEYRNGGDCHG